MAYLQESDYTLRISQDHLDEILAQAANTSGLTTATIRSNAENWAIARVTQILAPKYQIASEFARNFTDTARNFLIMGYVIDLALYTLHRTVNPRDVPAIREMAYREAIMDLKDSLMGVSPLYSIPLVASSVSADFVNSGAKFVSEPFKDGRSFDPTNPSQSPIPWQF